MTPYEDALRIVLRHARHGSVRQVTIDEALGLVLAREVPARFDMPRFDSSAVDGYGVRVDDVVSASTDAPVSLPVAGIVQAGDAPTRGLRAGTAIKIYTGAPIPSRVDAVVMREDCLEGADRVDVGRAVAPGENIRRRGEEFRKGDVTLPKGLRVTPPVIGLLAAFGHTRCAVYARPRITLVATGNELRQPGERLRQGEIYDSNSFALRAALRELHVDDVQVLHATDEPDNLRRRLDKALRTSDVVVTIGGVSVGDYDLVKETLEGLGVETLVWRVAIKPGKPFYCGILPYAPQSEGYRAMVFGLPGNPVSAMLCHHQLVKPALLKIMGCQPEPPLVLAARATASLRKQPGRLEWVRAALRVTEQGLTVAPAVGQGSHMWGGLTQANCLITLSENSSGLAAHDAARVELLHWGGELP